MRVATSNNKSGRKIVMKAVILHPILMSCLEGVTISQLYSIISSIMTIDEEPIKKYLFYMIEFNLITYRGKIKSFFYSKQRFQLIASNWINEVERKNKYKPNISSNKWISGHGFWKIRHRLSINSFI